MSNAFFVGSLEGYELLPDDLEFINCTGKGAHIAFFMEGKKKIIMLVTEDDVGRLT